VVGEEGGKQMKNHNFKSMSKPAFAWVILAMIAIATLDANGQSKNPDKRKRHFSVTEARIGVGYHGAEFGNFDFLNALPDHSVTSKGLNDFTYAEIDQFRALVPGSVLLLNNYQDHTRSESFYLGGFPAVIFSGMLGICLANPGDYTFRKHLMFRFGVSYYGGNHVQGNYMREVISPVDSAMDPVTGRYSYTDSLHRSVLDMHCVSDEIRFDASLVLRTNPKNSLTLYCGAGVSTGCPLMTYSVIEYNRYHQFITRYPDGKREFSESITEEEAVEQSYERRYFIWMPHAFAGFELRPFQKSPFLSMIHMFYETRVGVNVMVIGGAQNFVTERWHHCVGLKVKWN
jgi:hypothetical protein